MNMIFLDREKEVEAIRGRVNSPNFELIIVYGRRRTGKTLTVLKVLEQTEHVYYLATEKNNLYKFKQTAELKYPELKYVKEDWEAIFHALKDKVIVIDEFPYMVSEDKSILSTFQKIVDTLRNTRTKLILIGSSISVMTDVMSYKSPLYGRRTSSLKVRELPFKALSNLGLSVDEAIRVYGFAGGIPYYIVKVKTPFLNWVNSELKKVDSFIKDEVDFLLRYEFKDISTYKEILLAIALGKNTLKEIKDFVKVGGDISSYVKKLENIGIVKREVPSLEGIRSKKGRYVIIDNFVRFWFTFIYPNLSLIEEGKYEITEEEYNYYLSSIFEQVCREYVRHRYNERKVGRYWHKNVEIDILSENIVGECKWREDVNANAVLYKLKEKVLSLNLSVKKYLIFAKNFSKEVDEEDVELVDLKKLDMWFREMS
ncbi:ATP-binding protein [Acidianus sp. RZ1]|uniref:ATP-binding protein n=1 Tax=Acidianus sp. RZ1 TaxID=1540082 RepID=UPI001490BE3E|nr:ATP-binding protein [Acidianus sp. RZ1]